jgi:hypothetical protein
MGAADATKVFNVGCQLIWNPTDLSAAYPHGGTELGAIDEVLIKPSFKTSLVKGGDDKFAGHVVEDHFIGEEWLLGVVLRQWDDDIKNVLFPNTTTSSGVAQRTVRTTGVTFPPGSRMSSRAGKLLVASKDINAPSLFFRNASPILDPQAEVAMMAIDELAFPMMFRCYPATNQRLYEMGLLADLHLLSVLT